MIFFYYFALCIWTRWNDSNVNQGKGGKQNRGLSHYLRKRVKRRFLKPVRIRSINIFPKSPEVWKTILPNYFHQAKVPTSLIVIIFNPSDIIFSIFCQIEKLGNMAFLWQLLQIDTTVFHPLNRNLSFSFTIQTPSIFSFKDREWVPFQRTNHCLQRVKIYILLIIQFSQFQ